MVGDINSCFRPATASVMESGRGKKRNQANQYPSMYSHSYSVQAAHLFPEEEEVGCQNDRDKEKRDKGYKNKYGPDIEVKQQFLYHCQSFEHGWKAVNGEDRQVS